MESKGRFGQRKREDRSDREDSPAWTIMARPHNEFYPYARDLDGVRAFIDPDPASPMEFLASVGTVRRQLERLVDKAEETDRDISADEGFLAELRTTFEQFDRMQRSPLAWHDVHGGDADLMRKATRILSKLNGSISR